MSSPSPCVPCCTTPQTVAVPGPEGVGGADGLDGVNAYSLLTTPFTSDGNTTWTLGVSSSAWMVPGQIIVIGDATNGPVHLRVVSIPNATSVIAVELNYAGDGIGDAIPVGAKISPAGVGSMYMEGDITAAMAAGSVSVAPARLQAGSLILVSRYTLGGAAGHVAIQNRVDGTPGSFDIVSSSGTETSTFYWLVIG